MESMLEAAKDYEKTKDVVMMGEFKNGSPVSTK